MAKRGRKRKNKVTQLSAADKSHLSRILKKVRQIKSNKAAAAPPQASNSAAKLQAQQLFNAAQQAYTNFITRNPTPTGGSWQNTVNSLVAALNMAAERLNAFG